MIGGETRHAMKDIPYLIVLSYQLAHDLAFIAAQGEGVHTVSAATVEEAATEQGLTFTWPVARLLACLTGEVSLESEDVWSVVLGKVTQL